jgi:CDP-glucose 4,6-dehydratase
MQPKKFSGSWNFGPRGDSIRTVHDLAQGIVKKWGSGQVELDLSGGKLHEARLLHLNCDKAFQELGWRARWNFNRTVDETVAWYQVINDGVPAIEVSRRQILEYFSS